MIADLIKSILEYLFATFLWTAVSSFVAYLLQTQVPDGYYGAAMCFVFLMAFYSSYIVARSNWKLSLKCVFLVYIVLHYLALFAPWSLIKRICFNVLHNYMFLQLIRRLTEDDELDDIDIDPPSPIYEWFFDN